MASKVAVCALALVAFAQISSVYGCGLGNYGCNDAVVVDVDTFCVPTYGGYGGYGYGGLGGFNYGYPGCGYGPVYGGYPGFGYGYGYDGCGCGYDSVTEVTAVSCVPVVETFVEPAYGVGYGFSGVGGAYGGYGYPGYGYGCCPFYGGYPGFGYGYGCGY